MATKEKWHISPEIGPARCSAKIQCRYGDQKHYATEAEAYRAYEQQQPNQFAGVSRKHLARIGFFGSKSKPEVKAILQDEGRPSPPASGAIDDPISLKEFPDDPKGARISEAVRLIADGKHIRLHSEKEYSTMLYKLTDEMDAQGLFKKDENGNPLMGPFGRKYVPINVGLAAVPGSNLFCGETIGVPRAKMPQTAGVPTPGSRGANLPADRFNEHGEINLGEEFQQELKDLGITVEEKDAPPLQMLKASQSEIDGAKIRGIAQGMYLKACRGENPDPPKPSVVNTQGYLVDGHHGWSATIAYNSMVENGDLKMPDGSTPPLANLRVVEIDLDIGSVLDYTNDFCQRWGIASAGL